MSTKIYNAYKFHGSATELFNILKDYKKKWKKYKVEVINYLMKKDFKFFKEHGVSSFEYILDELRGKNLTKTPTFWKKYRDYEDVYVPRGLRDVLDHQTKLKMNSRSDQFDLEGSVVVYFHGDNIFYQTFLDGFLDFKFEIPTLIEDEALFSDYHYQNQTDPWFDYENLKGEEYRKAEIDYEERKKVWDDIFDSLSSPQEVGLVSHMNSLYLPFYVYNDVIQTLLEEQGVKSTIT